MAIAVVQTKTQAISSLSSSHQIQFPANVTVGNWVVIVWRQGTDNRTPGVPAPSAGTWSGVQDFLASTGGTTSRVYCWSAQQTGAATDTYTITISGGTSLAGIVAYELSGVDTGGTPRGGSGTQNLGSVTSWNLIASPGVDLTSGDIIIGAAGTTINASWGTLTAPSAFTTVISNNTSPWQSTWCGYDLTAATGITGAASNTSLRGIVTGYQVYKQTPAAGGGGTSGNLLTLGVG